MRLAIGESQLCVRGALAYFLQQQSAVELVGIFGAEPDLVAQLLAQSPEVLLLDWELPLQLARRILDAVHRLTPAPLVIVLSKRSEAEPDALAAGAKAFVCTGDGPQVVLRALRTISPAVTLPGGRGAS